jgi:hypothetical protein
LFQCTTPTDLLQNRVHAEHEILIFLYIERSHFKWFRHRGMDLCFSCTPKKTRILRDQAFWSLKLLTAVFPEPRGDIQLNPEGNRIKDAVRTVAVSGVRKSAAILVAFCVLCCDTLHLEYLFDQEAFGVAVVAATAPTRFAPVCPSTDAPAAPA